jgi:RHS repeat-associated protein
MLLIPASVRANSSPLVLTWDFDNRMVCADVGADSVIDVTHQYDALGRRVARTASGSTTVFVQVDQQTICDYASGAAPASSTYRYLYGSYIDEPIVRIATSNSETTWYHRNQQYSIVACTDSTGAATERYAYSAYGLPTITDGSGTVRTSSAIGNRYTYTGREWDGVLGLYHYRARMYEATVGRFCSRDPIGYAAGSKGLYEYCHSQPGKFIDPWGKQIMPPQPIPFLPFSETPPYRAPYVPVYEPPDPIDPKQACANIFLRWLVNETLNFRRNQTILQTLPNCPCSAKKPFKWIECTRTGKRITHESSIWTLPDPNFHDWDWDNGVIFGYGYHPGARTCMRSLSTFSSDLPRQQCCYDNNGDLITSGTGAGSPDLNIPDHISGEVDPFYCALILDDGRWDGPFVRIYNSFRPSNNSNNCKANRVDNPTAPMPYNPYYILGFPWKTSPY